MSKVILTNQQALQVKYGRNRPEIDAAIQALIDSDKKRGISTRLIALDSPEAMQDIGSVVKDHSDQRQNKDAVDAVYRELNPDYILLLGATDVIPHQDLANPAYGRNGDDDRDVPSDLPYACEGSWSTDAKDFKAVTRVVGRLPDITGTKDPTYLARLLDYAANAIALPPKDFGDYFGITAEVWETSTKLSLSAIFGSAADAQTVPPKSDRWSPRLLARRAHFVNCHGAPSTWQFFGQPKRVEAYPVAHDGTYISGKVTKGTVVAAECCYGAQLYDPAKTGAVSPGLCNVYLGNGAYGFLGSSTIAYGPADSNDWADDFCQFFWRAVLRGSSLGSAVLEARQEYVKSRPTLDPIDLKTLAQFNLLGDPSIHPVDVPSSDQPMPHAMGSSAMDAFAIGRTDRRRGMFMNGVAIANATAVAVATDESPSGSIEEALRSLATTFHMETPEVLSYTILQPPEMTDAIHGMRFAPPERERVHVVMGRHGSNDAPTPQVVVVVAKEVNGAIVSYRTAYSR